MEIRITCKKISKLIFAEAAHFTLISVEHFQDIGRTPVLELNMRTSCPDVDEKDSFKSPGPTTMVSFRGMSAMETCVLLLPEHLWQEYTNGIVVSFLQTINILMILKQKNFWR